MSPSVLVSTVTFKRYGILKCRQNVLESRHSELEFGHKFGFCWQKSRELLLFEYGPPSYPIYGFQLCSVWEAKKWKSNVLFKKLDLKYFSYITRSIIWKSNFRKKYFRGKLFTSIYRFGNVLKCELRSPFRH